VKREVKVSLRGDHTRLRPQKPQLDAKSSHSRRFQFIPEGDTITTLSALDSPHLLRALVGILAPLFVVLICRWLLRGGGLLCWFYELTGLYCPGCGSGRAAIALLHGHILEALSHNALFLLLGTPCGLLLIWEYLRFVFPGLELKKIELPVWTARLALGMVAVFWLLRNLPGFEILAP